ncbi:MAG: D-alanine--D-alanine ligase [Proteobacteria bacterium]|nr:D-alanine--D-alanine ligase [Pseudomonadota bacterium]
MTGRWKGKRVAVLMGGVSREREISLRTGSAISAALRRQGCEVVDIDVGWGAELVGALDRAKPEVALIALHGKFGEDGCVQGLLEMMRIPYTGGGVMASSVGMDKIVCKMVARELGVPCLPEEVFDAERNEPGPFAASLRMEMPVIVKPSREGSTINMTIVREARELSPAIEKAMESDSRVLVEKFVQGRELTVGLINGEALPVLEIAPKSGFYDYASKYTKGMTEYIVPARIGEPLAVELQRLSRRIYREIECEGTARVDFIAPSDDEAYFLEINTIPGMTELSLVPKAAAHVGIGFDEICLRLLDNARLKVNV